MKSLTLDVSSCLIDPGDGTPNWSFEPAHVIRPLPIDWNKSECPIIVTITDGDKSTEYDLNVFMSKTYVTNKKIIKFGAHRFDLDKIIIIIGWKIKISDLSDMIENDMD
jgi:hypothetical protein